jgi:glycerophosphoryl diester phosphodiesterase
MKRLVMCGLFCSFIAGMSGCTKSVEIIAHRGASYLALENTVASVVLSWGKKADVEFDSVCRRIIALS